MLRIFALSLPLLWICGTACKTATVAPGAAFPDMAVDAAAEPDAETEEASSDYKNTVRWSTASEVENFGFDVYRGKREEGPFVRLNSTTIPGSGTSDVPNYYQYVDTAIDPYREYYYYVESISIHGMREKFTPTYRVAPKIARDE